MLDMLVGVSFFPSGPPATSFGSFQGAWRAATGDEATPAAGVHSITSCDADPVCRRVLESLHEDGVVSGSGFTP